MPATPMIEPLDTADVLLTGAGAGIGLATAARSIALTKENFT